MTPYHPWGEFGRIIRKLQIHDWSILGCISYEERCLCVLERVISEGALRYNKFIRITDPLSEYSDQANEKTVLRVKKYDELLEQVNRNIEQCQLLDPSTRIVHLLNDFLNKSTKNIILDISSFPKRFFFPFIKILLKCELNTLIVTYSTAKRYYPGDLAEDPEPWEHLPLFGPVDFPEEEIKHAIVGIGFIPFGLSKLLKDNYYDIPISFLFPFPPGPPLYQRSWEFLRLIEKNYPLKKTDKIVRINAMDASDAFNYLKSITSNGRDHAILAPYGPKPLSLSFAIFASLSNSTVYYTQPKKYNPNYCVGYNTSYGYLLVNNGLKMYNI
jgi:hypothetical protein